MSKIYPWIRDYGYLNDYFWTVYQYYNESYKAYPITYYQLNYDETIWEDSNLLGGSYEKSGVGELSGVVWNKIVMLPVFTIEQLQPISSNTEAGLSYRESMNNNIAFPSSYNLRPSEGDIVDLNYSLSSNSPKIKPLYVITNVNMAHEGVFHQMWQCRLTIAPFTMVELEKQIHSYYMFMNSTHTIVSIDKADLLLKLEKRVGVLNDRLNNLFDDSSGFYLRRL